MRITVRVALFVAACAFVTPLDASAQERGGFWFGISLGPGSGRVQCTDCFFNDRRTEGTGVLKGGWTLNPRMLVGMELDLWLQESRAIEDPFAVSLTLSNFSGTFTYYPSASSGFYVKGGAGVASADLDGRAEGNAITINLGSGPGFVAGAGYDFPLWRRVSVTAGVDYWYGRLGNVSLLGDTFARNWTQNVVVVTFGIVVP
jgi:hypothetical protein